jgi:L-lactate dehydrogenase (cytochrome)
MKPWSSRERDVRRGFTLPPKIGFDTIIDGARHPEWSLSLVRNEPISFANVRGRDDINGTTAITLSDYVNQQFDPALSWDHLEWIREASDLPIILKGIQRVDDAQRAVDVGVQAIALSNHGGRQLDGGLAPVTLLPAVAQRVGGSIDIICDGGVRRGSDIVKACALGADAVMVGRPYLYALAVGGERGVEWVLDHLIQGMRRTMALVGRTSVDQLDVDLLNGGISSEHISTPSITPKA